jgi:glycosyltransferase involved in cell wall biosynthesis
MGHGRAVIGINRGTSAWLIQHEHNGLLFDPEQRGDLAKKILSLAANPDYAQQLGANCRTELALKFDDDRALEQILEIYQNIKR